MPDLQPATARPAPTSRAEVVLDRATLYHGSATPGITAFERAEDDTVGAGVYLAHEATAGEYARHRAGDAGTPVLYEVEIAHARLVDLTDQATVADVLTGFRAVLHTEHDRVARTGGSWHWEGALRQMIGEIDSGRGVHVGAVKLVTQRSGELFSGYLQDQGFDGVVALEGGEGRMAAHRTYLLFDPARLCIRAEQRLPEEPAAKSPLRERLAAAQRAASAPLTAPAGHDRSGGNSAGVATPPVAAAARTAGIRPPLARGR
ncbi:hypothetical protein IU501_33095 [Nocardia otitidiscaviarum]|uniref:hypothetical protein n=1 Tax=Nocardia otitidiscaviarum TaxID=1823 RepID=UPI0004A6ACEE|nr:hypothetical protein [Nocardia otitidiscaviarum]MBF6137809.1 hypothetical protein [Nocardia otitidiscaviarum]MBF6485332.1 hypothetical protein [Nocardia otitidiscaviarum]